MHRGRNKEQRETAMAAAKSRTPVGKTKASRRSPRVAEAPVRSQRLPREERERRIVQEAIRFFAEAGFGGDTRELAKRVNVTHPLLFRYFPSKDALIERVCAHSRSPGTRDSARTNGPNRTQGSPRACARAASDPVPYRARGTPHPKK